MILSLRFLAKAFWLTLLLLLFPVKAVSDDMKIVIDASTTYSLEPHSIRMPELWTFPDQMKAHFLFEYYCPEHENYGTINMSMLQPQGDSWKTWEEEEVEDNAVLVQRRQSACEILDDENFVTFDHPNNLLLLASRLNVSGRLNEAVEILQYGIEKYPNESALYNGLGLAFLNNNQGQRAIESYQQGINIATDNEELAVLYNNLGNALDDLGRFEEALSAYQQSIDANPKNPAVHFDLCLAWTRQENFEVAITECEKALEISPFYPDAASLLMELESMVEPNKN